VRAAFGSGPLANRDFQLLTAGQFTSTVGDYCYAVALPWLVLSTHGGPVLLGTVLACYGVPRTVLIPVGGMLADKLDPRIVMFTADAVRCLLVAALAVVAARRLESLAVLGPIAALLGAGEGVFLPAYFTIMPAILQPAQLQAGNALSTAMVQVGSLAGPVLGGILVTTAGSAPAFTVDSASFGISAMALALIAVRHSRALAAQRAPAGSARAGSPAAVTAQPATAAEPASANPASAAESGADIEPGSERDTEPGSERDTEPGAVTSVWSLLRQSRLLQVIVLVAVVANLTFAGTFEVALPALAHARFGAAGYGALIACFGAGSVAGTLAAARSKTLRRPAVAACWAFMGSAATICLVPFLGGLPGAAAAILVMAICNGFGNIVLITLLQQWAPSHLLGRVMSLVMLASMGTFPASVAVSGFLVHRLGPSPFFPVAGIVEGITVLVALTQRVMRDFGAAQHPQQMPGAESASPVTRTAS
jgi:MFS family permease